MSYTALYLRQSVSYNTSMACGRNTHPKCTDKVRKKVIKDCMIY